MDPATIAMLMGGGGALGAVAGGQKDYGKQSQGVALSPMSNLERAASSGIGQDYRSLRSLFNLGPGAQDVTAGLNGQRSLAEMLQQFAQGGFMPSQQDMSTANSFAQQMFAPQQLGLQQSFIDQGIQNNQLAARLGRPGNDPILAAKLADSQTRQQGMLNAQQGQWAQQYAMDLPGQRLGYLNQFANVQGGLASQALANRQALLSVGQNIQGAERNFRLGTATHFGDSSSGGGMKGAITGFIGGAGTGASVASKFSGAPSGGQSYGTTAEPNASYSNYA